MRQSVFMLKISNGEFVIVPFKHKPEKDVLTPEGFRRKRQVAKK